jgi:hypothetical protein
MLLLALPSHPTSVDAASGTLVDAAIETLACAQVYWTIVSIATKVSDLLRRGSGDVWQVGTTRAGGR